MLNEMRGLRLEDQELSERTQRVVWGLVCWIRTALRVLFGPFQIAIGWVEDDLAPELAGFALWVGAVLTQLFWPSHTLMVLVVGAGLLGGILRGTEVP